LPGEIRGREHSTLGVVGAVKTRHWISLSVRLWHWKFVSPNSWAASRTPSVPSLVLFQLERRMEQVKLLPRKKQQLVIEFLDAIISTEA
jgi:hypothetical protein